MEQSLSLSHNPEVLEKYSQARHYRGCRNIQNLISPTLLLSPIPFILFFPFTTCFYSALGRNSHKYFKSPEFQSSPPAINSPLLWPQVKHFGTCNTTGNFLYQISVLPKSNISSTLLSFTWAEKRPPGGDSESTAGLFYLFFFFFFHF